VIEPAVPPVPPMPPVPVGPAAYPAPAQPVYAPPPGYAPHAAPYTYPGGAARPVDHPTAGPRRRSSALGTIALVAALVAAVGAPVVASIAGFNVGLGAGRGVAMQAFDADFDWSMLSPVREWVLLGEISFWIGTAVGIWGLVQGIISIVTGRGRPQGIAATAVALLGPVLFAIAVQASITAGFAAGSSIGG